MNVTNSTSIPRVRSNGVREPVGYLSFSPAFIVSMVILHVLIIVIAVVGNIMVCSAMFVSPTLRKATTALFVASLAVSDLLTATLSIPFDIDAYILNDGIWRHSESLCKVYTTAYLITVPSSNLTLLVLSIDRLLTLSQPLSYFRESRFMTRNRAIAIVGCLWTYCIVVALLPVFGWSLEEKFVNFGYCYFNVTTIYNILASVFHFVLPSIAMAGIYFAIYLLVRKQTTRAIQPLDTPETAMRKAHTHRHIRASKRIAALVLAFFLCWFPYSAISIVGVVCPDCYNDNADGGINIPYEVYTVTLMMGYLTTALNPFLYSFNNRHFIDAYKKMYTMATRALFPVNLR